VHVHAPLDIVRSSHVCASVGARAHTQHKRSTLMPPLWQIVSLQERVTHELLFFNFSNHFSWMHGIIENTVKAHQRLLTGISARGSLSDDLSLRSKLELSLILLEGPRAGSPCWRFQPSAQSISCFEACLTKATTHTSSRLSSRASKTGRPTTRPR